MAAHIQIQVLFLILLLISSSSSGGLTSICFKNSFGKHQYFLYEDDGKQTSVRKLLGIDMVMVPLDYDYAGPNPKHDHRKGKGGGGRNPP